MATTIIASNNNPVDIQKLRQELSAWAVKTITPGPSYLNTNNVVEFVGTLSAGDIITATGIINAHTCLKTPGIMHITGDVSIAHDLTITNNLDVEGTETIIHTEELTVEDNLITVDSTAVGPLLTDVCGIDVYRGGGSNQSAQLIYDERTGQTPGWKARPGATGGYPAAYQTLITDTALAAATIQRAQIAAGTANRVLYNGAAGAVSESDNLTWDDTNKTLALVAAAIVNFAGEGTLQLLPAAGRTSKVHFDPTNNQLEIRDFKTSDSSGKVKIWTNTSNGITIDGVNGIGVSGVTTFANDVYADRVRPSTATLNLGSSSCTTLNLVSGSYNRLVINAIQSVLYGETGSAAYVAVDSANVTCRSPGFIVHDGTRNRIQVTANTSVLYSGTGSQYIYPTSTVSGSGPGVYLGGGMLHFDVTTSIQTPDNSEAMNLSNAAMTLRSDTFTVTNDGNTAQRLILNSSASTLKSPDGTTNYLSINNSSLSLVGDVVPVGTSMIYDLGSLTNRFDVLFSREVNCINGGAFYNRNVANTLSVPLIWLDATNHTQIGTSAASDINLSISTVGSINFNVGTNILVQISDLFGIDMYPTADAVASMSINSKDTLSWWDVLCNNAGYLVFKKDSGNERLRFSLDVNGYPQIETTKNGTNWYVIAAKP